MLDLMSSWISHLPEGVTYADVSGLGMNAAELEANPRLNHYRVQDLNINASLHLSDNAFDVSTVTVPVAVVVLLVAASSFVPGDFDVVDKGS